jgi:hypothetical protein
MNIHVHVFENLGSRRVRLLEFTDNRHMKVVGLSSLRTGRMKSLKNSSDSLGNRTRDLPACSGVPQATALSRTPVYRRMYFFVFSNIRIIYPKEGNKYTV